MYRLLILIFIAVACSNDKNCEQKYRECIGVDFAHALDSIVILYDNFIIENHLTPSEKLDDAYLNYINLVLNQGKREELKLDSITKIQIFKVLDQSGIFNDGWIETKDSTGWIIVPDPSPPNEIRYLLLDSTSTIWNCLDLVRANDSIIDYYLEIPNMEYPKYSIFDLIHISIVNSQFTGIRKSILVLDLYILLSRFEYIWYYR